MKHQRVARLVVLFVLIPCLAICAESPRERIDRLLSAYHESGQFNGVILVKQGDTVIYERAFGLANREWNVANTLDSKFLIGSVSKAYTALMVLILANEGLIDLNATINTYLPGYEGPGRNQATIHQMLTHTSGIPDHGGIPDLLDGRNGLKAESMKIFAAGLADYPDDFRLNYYLAAALTGVDDKRAIDLFKTCIRLYLHDESNKRFSAEYGKALVAVNASR